MVRDSRLTRSELLSGFCEHEISAPVREWCRRLAQPHSCTWIKERRTSTGVAVRGRWAGLEVSSETVEEMLSCGLLQFEQRLVGHQGQASRIEYVAVLTDAGKAACMFELDDDGSACVDLFAASGKPDL